MQAEKQNYITIGDIIFILKKNFILMISIAIIILATGTVYTFGVVTPDYRASSTVVVAIKSSGTSSNEDVNYLDSLRVVATVSQLCKEDIVLAPVAAKYSKYSIGQIRSMISVSSSNSSYLIKIVGISEDKENIAKIVDGVVESLITQCSDEKNTALYELIGTSLQPTSKAQDLGASYNSPNKTMYVAIFLLIGIIVALGVVLVKELFSNTFKNKKDVESTVGDKITGIFVDKIKKKDANKKEEFVIMENSIDIESYNKLLANIKYSSFDKEQKVIMVTSSVMNELKSTICANLALCMAKNNKKVIVLDLDLRKPVMYKYFNLSKINGLVEYASKEIELKSMIKNTGYGVDVITSGDNLINPVVMLESDILKNLILELKEMYDYVLIDTPPVGVCSDSLIVSKLVDGVLFNIAMNSTKKSHVKDALQSLNNVKANLIGVNLTKYNFKGDSAGYNYNYNSNYGYSEKNSNESSKKFLKNK